MKNSKQPLGVHQKLQTIIDRNIRCRVDGKVSSHATRNKVAATQHLCIRELKALGYRLDGPKSLKGKHVKALGEYYERLAQKGKMSASTIQGRFTALRSLSRWAGKTGMVERTENYVSPEFCRRTTVCTQDKSGQAQGIDVETKLEEICAKDSRVGLQLKLELEFGLRCVARRP
jgi:Phage integrase, N-terminal